MKKIKRSSICYLAMVAYYGVTIVIKIWHGPFSTLIACILIIPIAILFCLVYIFTTIEDKKSINK